ncbi:MAG: DNA-processing protein DprA, partial [Muribaculaceae bacterium]|nr:DNA-processing protein DprA [Muribaculaceae bacterium]
MNNLHSIAFSLIKGNNPRMASQILNRIGSEEEFFTLSEQALSARLEFKGKILEGRYRLELLEKAKAETDFIAGHNIRAVYFTDQAYPRRLLECDDAPVMLYALGETDLNAAHVVSVVGTRNATHYGIDFIEKLISTLAEKIDNLVIVSGLAFGCDIAAHRQALALGIPTVGVVAHGLDTLYPAEHRNYAAKMVREGGMILTDYPHGTTPHRGNFLARNRIVAGVADCIVVAESAAGRGGALHTAKLGMLYNRDVFALPGRTSDLYSGGCNMLIKTNVAHLIENADDIIAAMNWQTRPEEGSQPTLFH